MAPRELCAPNTCVRNVVKKGDMFVVKVAKKEIKKAKAYAKIMNKIGQEKS